MDSVVKNVQSKMREMPESSEIAAEEGHEEK